MIPIGAFSPIPFMSQIHTTPEDAVNIHLDVKSAKSVGIHWGCWVLTDEPVNAPKERLEACMKARGLPTNEFDTLPAIGATIRVKPKEW